MKKTEIATTPRIDTRTRMQALLKTLNEGLYEREEAMALALISALAGESIFLLGPPGVAKSMIARRLKYAFQDGHSFEYLMNRFSTPDEVFGPVSISKLRLEDKYERKTERYLPGAQIVFLDEIWKAGPAIQNALLTVINEKVYRNGEQEVPVELRGLIAASNELPEKGQGLEALWDRFLLRLQIGNIRSEDLFFEMITSPSDTSEDPVPDELKIQQEELEQWAEQIDQVEVPAEVRRILMGLRNELNHPRRREEAPLEISDRRWKKVVRLLRTIAFFHGRQKVSCIDCLLLSHCLWNKTEEIQLVQETVQRILTQILFGEKRENLSSMKRKLDNRIREQTTRIEEIKQREPQLYDLPDGHRYYLIRIPDDKDYYIKEADFHQLHYDEPQKVGLAYAYKKDYRTFSQARVRRPRTPHTLIVGDKVGKLQTVEIVEEVSKRVRPPARQLQQLQDHVRKFRDMLEKTMHEFNTRQAQLQEEMESHVFQDQTSPLRDYFSNSQRMLQGFKLEMGKWYTSLDFSDFGDSKE